MRRRRIKGKEKKGEVDEQWMRSRIRREEERREQMRREEEGEDMR